MESTKPISTRSDSYLYKKKNKIYLFQTSVFNLGTAIFANEAAVLFFFIG